MDVLIALALPDDFGFLRDDVSHGHAERLEAAVVGR